MKTTFHVVFGVCIFSAFSGLSFAESQAKNWPTWRGPQNTGVAVSAKPPLTWSETKNVKWKVAMPGEGTSSPVVWDDKIFFMTAIPTGKNVESAKRASDEAEQTPGGGRGPGRAAKSPTEIYKFDVVCLDRKTGKTLWQETATELAPHQNHHPTSSYVSSSPITDGKYVWANFGSRGLYCYDMDGKQVWGKDLPDMDILNDFGEGSSPALAGDAVVVVADHEGESKIMAFHKETGNPLWETARDEGTTWGTPLAVPWEGKLQIITNGTNRVRSYDAGTGELIWECGGQTDNAIPTPVFGHGMVYCTSGFRGSALLAIQLGHTGNLTDGDAIKWKLDEATPYIPSPVLYDGKLYINSGKRAVVSCYDAKDGKPNFVSERLGGISDMYASPVGANGHIYFTGREGMTKVIKHSDTFEIVAENKLDDEIDATPAIVGNEVILKGKQNIYCISES